MHRGRRIAVKEANRWNRFLQTDQARLIFAESKLRLIRYVFPLHITPIANMIST
jgi:hypothetical protein